MQREFKFRAWHKGYSQFDTPKMLSEDYSGECFAWLHLRQPLIIMQFTGLHDATKWTDLTDDELSAWIKNGNMHYDWKGKEAYEGDIVDVGNNNLYFIDYKNDRFWLSKKTDCTEAWKDGHYRIHLAAYIKDSLIVGNIYENPELINERV